MVSKQGLPRLGVVLAACVWAAGAAQAQSFNEVESNNTLATAQLIANTASPFTIAGSRSFADPSDDFFTFSVLSAGVLTIRATSPDPLADSILGLFDKSGMLVASNDDGPGMGSMSAITYNVGAAQVGSFSVGISGYNPGLLACGNGVTACYDTDGDFIFDTFVAGGGAGGSTGWNYTLSISVAAVPEPASALLLVPGLLLIAARRKRSA
jgi:hypothetical protein